MTTWLFDVESRSRCDLKKHGGRAYWAHPSTEVLCIVLFDVERWLACPTGHLKAGVVVPDAGGRPYCDECAPVLWLPGDPCPIAPDDVLAAHNVMGFDRFAVARVGWRALDEGPEYIDTSHLARTAGLPGSLDALGLRWLGIPKDKEASRFTVALSTCRRPIKAKPGPEGRPYTAEEWRVLTDEEKRDRGYQKQVTIPDLRRVVDYCFSDVDILVHSWPRLAPWRDVEPEVVRVDRIINDRGIAFDVPLARRLLEEDARNTAEALEETAKALGLKPAQVREIAGSPKQFGEWTGLPNAQKGTLDDYLAAPYAGPEVALMCRARQSLASIARGKLEAGLARVSPDGRLRDMLRYFAAHTGRWGGSGLQPQNLPKPHDDYESWSGEQIDALAREVTAGRRASAQEIDLLLRATLCAPEGKMLAVSDYSGVESMALAVCAGDQGALDVTASGRKNYTVMASHIFGVPYEEIGKGSMYAVGKMAELLCQYAGGARMLDAQAQAQGVDFEAAGTTAADVVDAWRKLHAPIVRFWRELEDAFRAAVQYHETTEVSCFEVCASEDGRDVAVFLPSGRPLVYPGMCLKRDDKFGDRPRLSLAFQGHRGIEHTHGGKLTENVIQALCREFLAYALVEVERAKLRPVLHVHDECVTEAPESRAAEALEELNHHMVKSLPDWARDFPLKTAGFVGKRYRK